MYERCINAYRKPGKNAVFCKAIPSKDMDYCINEVMCKETRRFEASECMNCKWKDRKPVDKEAL